MTTPREEAMQAVARAEADFADVVTSPSATARAALTIARCDGWRMERRDEGDQRYNRTRWACYQYDPETMGDKLVGTMRWYAYSDGRNRLELTHFQGRSCGVTIWDRYVAPEVQGNITHTLTFWLATALARSRA